MTWALLPMLFVSPVMNAVGPPTWGELGLYFSAVLVLAGAAYTATVTRRNGREANAITFNKNLLDRVTALEKKDEEKDGKIAELAAGMSVSLSYIERLIIWGRGGGKPPEPATPQELRERLEHLIHQREGG